jgi:2Fe-2S iron-sulfur cluster binding domain
MSFGSLYVLYMHANSVLIVQCFASLQIELSMNGETKTLTVEEGTSILEAAEIAFDDPPFSCRNGVCTTCK